MRGVVVVLLFLAAKCFGVEDGEIKVLENLGEIPVDLVITKSEEKSRILGHLEVQRRINSIGENHQNFDKMRYNLEKAIRLMNNYFEAIFKMSKVVNRIQSDPKFAEILDKINDENLKFNTQNRELIFIANVLKKIYRGILDIRYMIKNLPVDKAKSNSSSEGDESIVEDLIRSAKIEKESREKGGKRYNIDDINEKIKIYNIDVHIYNELVKKNGLPKSYNKEINNLKNFIQSLYDYTQLYTEEFMHKTKPNQPTESTNTDQSSVSTQSTDLDQPIDNISPSTSGEPSQSTDSSEPAESTTSTKSTGVSKDSDITDTSEPAESSDIGEEVSRDSVDSKDSESIQSSEDGEQYQSINSSQHSDSVNLGESSVNNTVNNNSVEHNEVDEQDQVNVNSIPSDYEAKRKFMANLEKERLERLEAKMRQNEQKQEQEPTLPEIDEQAIIEQRRERQELEKERLERQELERQKLEREEMNRQKLEKEEMNRLREGLRGGEEESEKYENEENEVKRQEQKRQNYAKIRAKMEKERIERVKKEELANEEWKKDFQRHASYWESSVKRELENQRQKIREERKRLESERIKRLRLDNNTQPNSYNFTGPSNTVNTDTVNPVNNDNPVDRVDTTQPNLHSKSQNELVNTTKHTSSVNNNTVNTVKLDHTVKPSAKIVNPVNPVNTVSHNDSVNNTVESSVKSSTVNTVNSVDSIDDSDIDSSVISSDYDIDESDIESDSELTDSSGDESVDDIEEKVGEEEPNVYSDFKPRSYFKPMYEEYKGDKKASEQCETSSESNLRDSDDFITFAYLLSIVTPFFIFMD